MKLYVARHGETTWNVEKRLLGSTPGELTERGKEQARLLAEHIGGLSISVGYVSSLKRAVDTAEIIHSYYPELAFTLSDLLRERNFGDFEGKDISEADRHGFWELPPDSSAYNAETLTDFTTRVAEFIKKLSEESDQAVLLVTHIGVVNRIHFLSNPDTFEFVHYSNADAIEFDLEALGRNSEALLAGKLTVR